MNENYTILEYNKDFEKKVRDFLINICVYEFGFESWREELESEEREKYKKSGGNFWIAINDDKNIIGTIALKKLDNKKGMLKSMYVDSKYRGSKVAQELMDELLKYALKKEFNKIELGTYTYLERAVGFYRKNGFELKEQNDDVLIFEKNICNA